MGTMLHDPETPGRTSIGSVKERAEHALEIAKRKMGPVHDQVRHLYHAAKGDLESAGRDAEHGLSSEGTDMESGETMKGFDLARTISTVSRVVKGLSFAIGIVKAVQKLDPNRAGIPWRRPVRARTGLNGALLFGAGALAGVGAYALIKSVAKGDGPLAQRLENLKVKAMEAMDRFSGQANPTDGGPTDADPTGAKPS